MHRIGTGQRDHLPIQTTVRPALQLTPVPRAEHKGIGKAITKATTLVVPSPEPDLEAEGTRHPNLQQVRALDIPVNHRQRINPR